MIYFDVHDKVSSLRAKNWQATIIRNKLLMSYVHLLMANDMQIHPRAMCVTKVIV